MCGFQQAGRQWLQSGCLVCRPILERLLILSMGSLLQGFPSTSPGYILGTNLGTWLLVPVKQCQMGIVPKWYTKSGNGHCQVQQSCRCSMLASRVFWLELDKALLDSYTVLQEGILCDVFSQKCSAAWQGAPGQRLTIAIMLPGRQGR